MGDDDGARTARREREPATAGHDIAEHGEGIISRLSASSRSIEGHVALVTGAASGIGRATARLLADEGAHVAVTDVTDGIDAVADEIREAGGTATALPLDVTDAAGVHRAVTEAVDRLGALDIVINNAGVARFSPIDDEGFDEAWETSLDVLLTGPTRVIRAALPHLRQSAAGRIVNLASTEGFGATKFGSPYTAAKHGVIGLTRSLALELAPDGITVNCICPGPVDTGMTAAIPDEDKARFARRRTALGRYADPEEIAHGILAFCPPGASYLTGTALPVDGGLLIRNA